MFIRDHITNNWYCKLDSRNMFFKYINAYGRYYISADIFVEDFITCKNGMLFNSHPIRHLICVFDLIGIRFYININWIISKTFIRWNSIGIFRQNSDDIGQFRWYNSDGNETPNRNPNISVFIGILLEYTDRIPTK